LLLDLVAMLIADVHMRNGPQVRGSPAEPLLPAARDFLLATHCNGAPATPFPPLQMASTTTSPINCFAPVEYWQKSPNIRSSLRLSIAIWWC
jgi:hypothetical protein